jgi:hypothetical protein
MAGLRPSLSQFRAIGQHATYIDWGIQFITLPPALNTSFSSEDLNARALSATIPKKTMQKTEIMMRGHRKWQHGICDYGGQISLGLYELTDVKTEKFLLDWYELLWQSDTGAQLPKQDVECDILLTRLDTANNRIAEYKLVGCWLEDYDYGSELQSNVADSIIITPIISFDTFTHKKII